MIFASRVSEKSITLYRLFYVLKPLIPRRLQIAFRRFIMKSRRKRVKGIWPISRSAARAPLGWKGWPSGKKFALLLGHDVDTAKGRDRCLALMEIEQGRGLVSSFNFVAEGYDNPPEIRQALLSAGFEVGVHGLKHDGKLFSDRRVFNAQAPKINAYLRSWGSVGFYSPSMLRNAEYISELDIEYSCSTFDLDPFEPQPIGMHTIFPFIYRSERSERSYVEIPYTMPQDHNLFIIFEDKNIDVWERKLDWIVENGGLVRLNTHPDYMMLGAVRGGFEEYPIKYYLDFLDLLMTRYKGQFWNVLPRDLAKFWRESFADQPAVVQSHIKREKIVPSICLRNSDRRDAPKRTLILLENSIYRLDPRVKNEAFSLSNEGWEVDVICPSRGYQFQKEDSNLTSSNTTYEGIRVHDYQVTMGVKGVRGFLQEYIVAFYHFMRISWSLWGRQKFSVIHLCNPPDYLFLIALVYKLLGCKVIFDHHDLFPEMTLIRLKGMTQWLTYRAARVLEYLTFRVADIVISTNLSYKEMAIKRGGFNPDKVFVVRNGPLLSKFAPEEPDAFLKRGFAFMASYAGVMNKEDGVFELIDVIDYVINNLGRKDIIFYLLGTGGVYNDVVLKVERKDLSKFVKLPGFITNGKQFRTILSTSDVLLAPELSNPLNDKSTFIKIAEYLAIGRPIVAYDLKETMYTARDSAVYVPSGDIEAYARQILTILGDPARSAEMGMLGRRRVADTLCWEHQSIILKDAYDLAYRLKRSN